MKFKCLLKNDTYYNGRGGHMKKMKIILWTCLALIVIICAIFIYAKYIEPNRLIVRNVDLVGEVAQDVKIVQFSDTHFKEDYPAEKAEKIVEEINAQDPDIVIFTGDLFDHYYKTPEMSDQLQPYFSQIKAKYGKYAVFGNHDNGGGAIRIYQSFMESCGFEVLKNDSAELPDLGIALLGIDDPLTGRADLSISEHDLQPYQLFVSHEPDLVDQVDLSTIDLTISGHTHGGQVNLPFIVDKILPSGGKNYRKGLYELSNSLLYVSSGIGTTQISMRLGNVPEIIVFHIKSK